MQDIYDIIKNIERIYDSPTNFQILKDFERVLDELNVYVYDNWMNGELAEGPIVNRHWVTCKFFWLRKNMPDPEGGKRLLDYNCKITYQKEFLIKPRKIRTPDDIRPGTKKGKLDREAIWIVSITMPKKLIADIYRNYKNDWDWETAPNEDIADSATSQPADMAVDPAMTNSAMTDPGIDPALPADAAPTSAPAVGGTA